MTDTAATAWSDATVRRWLENRIAASRLDQSAAERAGWSRQDDCDKATAEELVCTHMLRQTSANDRTSFVAALGILSERDDHSWRGVYDDTRFDRHVRSYIRQLVRMAKANERFEKTGRYR